VYGTRDRYALLFRLSGASLYVKSDSAVEQVCQGLRVLLHHLPEGWGLQFRVRTRVGIPEEGDVVAPVWCGQPPDPSGPDDFRQDPAAWYRHDRQVHFHKRTMRTRELTLALISFPEKEQSRVRPSFYPLRDMFDRPPRFSRNHHERRLATLSETGALLENLLPGCGIQAERLDGKGLRDYLASILNPSLPVRSWRPSPDRRISLAEELAQTAFTETKTGLVAHHPDGAVLHGRLQSLRSWPVEVDRDTLAPFLEEADFSHDLVMNLWKAPRKKTLDYVQGQMTVSRFLSLLLPGRSYRLENEKRQRESFLESAFGNDREGGDPFAANLSLCFWAEEEEDLAEMGQEIFRAYSGVPGALIAHEPYRQWPLFLSGLPLQPDAGDRWELLLSEHLPLLLPVWDKSPDDHRPWFWSHNHLDEPVGLDLWNPFHPNHNGLVLGSSGSGKSFASKLLLGQFLSESSQHEAIVVESGGDFEKFCRFFNGRYVKIDLGGEFSLNPFPERFRLRSGEGLSSGYDPDVLGLLGSVLETFITPSLPVGPIHRRILLACVENVYDRLEDGGERPVLSMLAQELLAFRGKDREDESLSYAMGKILESWASGIYQDLVNHPGGFDYSERLVAFDLAALENHPAIKGIVFAFIASLSLFRLREGGPDRKLYLVFDEAHRILRELKGTEFLSHLYRTVRKWGGGVIAITQSPADLLEEDLAAGLLNNTFWTWVFPLANGHERLAELGFDERTRDLVKTLESVRGRFSEGLLRIGSDSRILRLEPFPLAFWLGARSPEEDRVFREAIEKSGGFREALTVLCRPEESL
jgi:hypothetical protein